MENVKAMLLANTDVDNLTVENFNELQQVVNNPMVIFLDETTNKVLKHFRIAAETKEHLIKMFEQKYFDTLDLPEGKYVKVAEAYFVGCGPREEDINKEDRTAATVRSS